MSLLRQNRLRTTAIIALFFISSLIPAYSASIYRVQRGDTLWSIAKKCHSTPEKIARINNINTNGKLALNQSLALVDKQITDSDINKNNSSNYQVMHTVTDNVCLRSGAGTGFARIAVLRQDTSVNVIFENGSWTKVKLSDGTAGFVSSSLIESGAGSVNYSRNNENASSSDSKNPKQSSLINSALACQGMGYRRGGTSRGGFDCSGFTRYIYAKQGINLPHSSAAQASIGQPVSKSELKPGDLVFFQTYRRGISHVGIYVGKNRFVHAATYRRGVRVDSLSGAYYNSRYRCARRIH